jgi:DNA-binding beta-propeller fold protein YncE
MSITLNRVVKAALWSVAALAVVGAGALFWLIYPGTPTSGKSLDFKGYVLLPGSKTLNVLDYLTVDGKRLFVTDESSGSVYRVALRDNTLPGEADVTVFASEPAAHGVIVDPSSRLAFVTRSEANTVDVFNPETMQLVKRIPVADDPDGIFYDPLNKLVYAAAGDSKQATLIDPATQGTIGTIPLGGKAEFATLDSVTRLLYQNLEDLDSVAAVDIPKRAVQQRWPLAGCEGPSGMAIDEPARRLFIVCSGNATLAIFDLNQHRVIGTFAIGGTPDSVAFDSELHRIYTTGKFGDLVVVQQETPDTYHVIEAIHLHYGAHTLAVDPATHFVYVGYASLVVRPRLAVFEPRT